VRWWVLLPVCIAGVVLADVVLYCIGYRYGDRVLSHRWMARLVPPVKRHAIEQNFHDYGIWILMVGRLVPGVRAPLFLTAGASRLSLTRFLIADGVGAVLGNSLLFFLGYFLGDQFKDALQRVESFKPILILALLVGLAAYLLYYFLRHPVATGNPEDVPLIGHQIAEHMKVDECPKGPAGQPQATRHALSDNGDIAPGHVTTAPAERSEERA
jgi:membrane protein DedA with SNARE-associated domain